ncbi:MAG: branched-chain amino acid ABC transporter permease [Fimbriimonadaceae bacterium]
MFWGTRFSSIILAILGCFALQLVAKGGAPYFQTLIVLAGVYVTLSVSLNLINGITGQFSIGHAAFYMIGAYSSGVLTNTFFKNSHIPDLLWLILMMVAGALFAAVAGFIVGLPSLRLKGDYLAIVTMGFGEIVIIIVRNQKALGESYGMTVANKIPSIFLTSLLAVTCIALCRNLLKNVHGLSFLAVREDEVASSAMGVNVTRVKVTAFVIGSALAGAAGAVYGHSLGFFSPTNFTMDISFVILTMVVLGGSGSITGATVAAIVLFYIPEWLRDLKIIPMSGFIGAIIATIAVVAIVKRTIDGHKEKGQKTAIILGSIVGGIALTIALRFAMKGIPGLEGTIDGNKLRSVVLAAVLVILMLLRPQGIFAHHEFSWSWVKRLFRKRKAVSA